MSTLSAPQWHSQGPSLHSSGLAYGNVRGSSGTGEGDLKLGPVDQIVAAFGPAPTQQDMNSWYDSQPQDHYLLPQAYRGQNKHIMGIIIAGLQRNRKNSPFQRIAPIELANGLRTTTMEIHEYTDTTWDAEPEEGVARMVNKVWRRWTTSTWRAGKAFRMENGFAMTDKGKQDYFNTITQIVCGLRDRLDLSCLFSIMNPPTTSDILLAQARSRGFAHHQNTVELMLEAETTNFGCLQKNDGNNTDVFFSQIDEQFRRQGSSSSRPRLILVPPGTKRLVESAPSNYASYQEMGDLGARLRDSGNMWTRSANKFSIETVEVDDYPLEENAPPQCPLIKEVVVGEHHVVNRSRSQQDFVKRDGRFDIGSLDLILMNFTTNMTNIIRYPDMLRATGIWDSHGTMTNEFGVHGNFAGYSTLGEWAAAFGYVNTDVDTGVANGVANFAQTAHAAARRGAPLAGINNTNMAAQGKVIADIFERTSNSQFVSPTRRGLIQSLKETPTQFDSDIVKALSYALTSYALFDKTKFLAAKDIPAALDLRTYPTNAFGVQGMNDFLVQVTVTNIHNWVVGGAHTRAGVGLGWHNELRQAFMTAIGAVVDTGDAGRNANAFADEFQAILRANPRNTVSVAVSGVQNCPVTSIEFKFTRNGMCSLLIDWINSYEWNAPNNRNPYPLHSALITEAEFGAAFNTPATITAADTQRISRVGNAIASAFLTIQGALAQLDPVRDADAVTGWNNFWSSIARPMLWSVFPMLANSLLTKVTDEVHSALENNRDLDSTVFTRCAQTIDSVMTQFTDWQHDPVRSGIPSVLTKPIGQVTQGEFLEAVSARQVPEIGVFICRPDMCFMMGSAVSCHEGCAKTYLADPNFMLESNASQKTLFGHVTAYSACVVMQPKEIVLVPNVRHCGYIGGGACTFWDPLRPAHRVAYADGSGIYGRLESMFAIPLNPDEKMQHAKWSDIAGFFPKNLGVQNPKLIGDIPKHMPRYAQHWNWSHKSLRYGPNSFNEEPLNNTLTRQGCSAVRLGEKFSVFADSGSWLGDVMYNGLVTDLVKGHVDRRKGDKGLTSAVEALPFDVNDEYFMDGGRLIRNN